MKKLIAMCALVTPLLASVAFAQSASAPAAPAKDAAKAPTAQQEKMKTCNTQAGDKKGDERKAFMKECLSAKSDATPKTQQEKMSACSKEGKGKKGDEYKAYMKECLSKSA